MKKDNKRALIISWIFIILLFTLWHILFGLSWFIIMSGLIVSGTIFLNPKRTIKIFSISLVVLVDLIYIFFF